MKTTKEVVLRAIELGVTTKEQAAAELLALEEQALMDEEAAHEHRSFAMKKNSKEAVDFWNKQCTKFHNEFMDLHEAFEAVTGLDKHREAVKEALKGGDN